MKLPKWWKKSKKENPRPIVEYGPGFYWNGFYGMHPNLKGRSLARREYLSLLSERQRFCLRYLGRYTLVGASGMTYKVQMDTIRNHQWFYVLKKPNHHYYFSITTRTAGPSTHADIYTSLATIHLNLMSNDLAVLKTANWEHTPDQWAWRRDNCPMPPKFTYSTARNIYVRKQDRVSYDGVLPWLFSDF